MSEIELLTAILESVNRLGLQIIGLGCILIGLVFATLLRGK